MFFSRGGLAPLLTRHICWAWGVYLFGLLLNIADAGGAPGLGRAERGGHSADEF